MQFFFFLFNFKINAAFGKAGSGTSWMTQLISLWPALGPVRRQDVPGYSQSRSWYGNEILDMQILPAGVGEGTRLYGASAIRWAGR